MPVILESIDRTKEDESIVYPFLSVKTNLYHHYIYRENHYFQKIIIDQLKKDEQLVMFLIQSTYNDSHLKHLFI